MKINVILKKEDINPLQITNNHVVVVLDIILATSTIVSLLHAGAKEVYPVNDRLEALSLSDDLVAKSPLLVGEEDGELIDDFLAPSPLLLRDKIRDKTIILSTTNGTVAIRKVSHARKVYIGSLLNNAAVAKAVCNQNRFNQTVHIVCSGSSSQFCMEDFYGAGHLIYELIKLAGRNQFELSDSALNSYLFYEKYSSVTDGEHILRKSRVGDMLIRQGFSDDISYVSKQGKYKGIPELNKNRIIIY